MQKLFFVFCAAAALTLLSGCLYPHTSQRSPETRGRVVDSQNGLPVAGAKVRWLEQSRPSALTDASGAFHLESSKNWHVLYFGHASVPNHGRHSWYLFVTHPNYSAVGVANRGGGERPPITMEHNGTAQNAKNVEALLERLRAEAAAPEQAMRAAEQAAREAVRKAEEDRKRNQ